MQTDSKPKSTVLDKPISRSKGDVNFSHKYFEKRVQVFVYHSKF